ncbi:MAG TPA: hypothetical protein PLQ81_06995, partial [bacterium]|nr:hypothetical protein [bacterium]
IKTVKILFFSAFLFSVILFPFYSPVIIGHYISSKINETGYDFRFKKISYIFPFGYRFEKLELKNKSGEINLKINELTVKPSKFFKYFIFLMNIEFSNVILCDKYGESFITSGAISINEKYSRFAGLLKNNYILKHTGWTDITNKLAFGKESPQIFFNEILFDVKINGRKAKINRINLSGNANGKITGGIKLSGARHFNLYSELNFTGEYISLNRDFIKRLERIKKIEFNKTLVIEVNSENISLADIILKNKN